MQPGDAHAITHPPPLHIRTNVLDFSDHLMSWGERKGWGLDVSFDGMQISVTNPVG
jgi:hypothetical protein